MSPFHRFLLIVVPLLVSELASIWTSSLGLRFKPNGIGWLLITTFIGLPIALGVLGRWPRLAFPRRYLRIRVRGLIVLVLLIAVCLGWMTRSARVQREAVRTITKAGGFLQYDWELWRGLAVPGARPPAPDWLVRLLGIDYFGNVVTVRWDGGHPFHDPEVELGGATLTSLAALTHLEALVLDHTSLDDAGLAKRAHLRRLRWLGLSHTHVSEAGLIHLKGMPDLEWLSVGWTGITDAGANDLLKGRPNLMIVR